MVRAIGPVILAAAVIANFTGRILAQSDNPVYVDDSPQAWELFRQAQDQARNNGGEAVRLHQELLDEFALKLIPGSAGEVPPEQYKAVRQRVLEALSADPKLLERYRLIQTPEAERLLQANELERLVLTRSLTEPGLEALLRLGQRDLESAHFRMALSWLNQALAHPDLAGRRAAHCYYMIGLAAHDVDEPEQFKAAHAALLQLGTEGESFAAQLDRLAAHDDRPALEPSLTPLDRAPATDLSDLVGQAIWSVPLEDSLSRRRAPSNPEEQLPATALLDQRVREASLTTAVPTVAGSTVFINEGHTVLAINRLTGITMWSKSDIARLPLPEAERPDALDLSVIAVSDNSLVTLTGYASPNARSEAGKVICRDPETGLLRWPPVGLGGLLDSASPEEDLFPHGAPIIADGMVFISARKVSLQSLTSAYVVALDLADGHVRWVRHITSSGGLQTRARPFCTLVYDHGGLYVSSAVGAAARLEPSTGEIRWLRRFNVPISANLIDTMRRPWEISGPVVTTRGVVTIEPDQRRVVLLDLETGEQLETHSSSSSSDWNQPRYLLADQNHVFSIGSEIRAFSVDDLEHPVWRLPALAQSGVQTKTTVEPPAPLDIRGRVQVVEGALVVPTADGVLVVASDTGAVQQKIAVATIGNPLAVDSQLLVACGDKLDAYMSFSKAEQMLRQRIAQTADDPDPALSLLQLGMRVRNLALSLEAADLATKAINRLSAMQAAERRAGEKRDELFTLLLELASAKVATAGPEGESLYATISAAAVDPEQRVEYLLSYGDWLADHALDKAVESYQTILSDQLLAGTWRGEGDALLRPASTWAAQRLAALIDAHGPAAYAPQADYAAIRLKQLSSAPGTSGVPKPEDLMALAQEYPFSDAAIDAALAAANIHLKRGQSREALADLITVHRAAPRRQTAARLVGAFVKVCQDAGWDAQARAALRDVVSKYGDLPLVTPNVEGPSTKGAAVWLAAVQAASLESARLPRLGDAAGESQPIDGGLVPAYGPAARPVMPADRVLLRDGTKLQLISSAKMETLWTQTVTGEYPKALRFDGREIVLWFDADPLDPKAVMLDAKDGKPRWTTPRITDVLGDPVRELARTRGIRDQMGDGEPFEPMQIIPCLSAQSIILVQRSGGVAALDLADGQTVRWSKKQTLEQVHLVALHECALVLAGMAREVGGSGPGAGKNAGELTPRIVALDPQTGQSLLGAEQVIRPLGRRGVKWMKASPLGLLVYATGEGIEVFDLYTGRRAWTNSTYGALDSQRAWLFDERLVIEDQRSRLHSVDLRSGSVSEPFETPSRGEWDPLELRDVLLVNDKIIAQYPQRIVSFDPGTGAVVGSDVISDERDYWRVLPASGTFGTPGGSGAAGVAGASGGALPFPQGGKIDQPRLIVVSAHSTQAAIGAQPGMRSTQYVYRIFALSENGKVLGQPYAAPTLGDKVQQAAIIDGWLLLSTQTVTLAIPMPEK